MGGVGKRRVGGGNKARKGHKQAARTGFAARHVDQARARPPSPGPSLARNTARLETVGGQARCGRRACTVINSVLNTVSLPPAIARARR